MRRREYQSKDRKRAAKAGNRVRITRNAQQARFCANNHAFQVTAPIWRVLRATNGADDGNRTHIISLGS